MVGAGQVVADRRGRERAAEHRARVADEREQGLGIVDQQLEVLGGDGVGHRHGLVGVVAHHRVAPFGQGRLEVLAAGRRGHEPGHRLGDGVGDRLVPREEPGQAVGAVLGLEDDVDRRPLGGGGGVGDDDDLGGPRERGRDADQALAGDLALGLRHAGRARSDDHVHGPDRLGAVGQGPDRGRTADAVHLVGPCQGRSREDALGNPAIGSRRADQHDLGHPGHLGRHERHQRRRHERGQGVGDVAAGPVDRTDELADLDRPVVVDDLVAPLGGVVGGDVVVRRLEGVAQLGGDGVERGPYLGVGHPQVVQHDPVEPLGEPAERGVPVGPHLGQDRPHLVDGRLGLGGGTRQATAQVVGTGSTQVESAEHDRQR